MGLPMYPDYPRFDIPEEYLAAIFFAGTILGVAVYVVHLVIKLVKEGYKRVLVGVLIAVLLGWSAQVSNVIAKYFQEDIRPGSIATGYLLNLSALILMLLYAEKLQVLSSVGQFWTGFRVYYYVFVILLHLGLAFPLYLRRILFNYEEDNNWLVKWYRVGNSMYWVILITSEAIINVPLTRLVAQLSRFEVRVDSKALAWKQIIHEDLYDIFNFKRVPSTSETSDLRSFHRRTEYLKLLRFIVLTYIADLFYLVSFLMSLLTAGPRGTVAARRCSAWLCVAGAGLTLHTLQSAIFLELLAKLHKRIDKMRRCWEVPGRFSTAATNDSFTVDVPLKATLEQPKPAKLQ